MEGEDGRGRQSERRGKGKGEQGLGQGEVAMAGLMGWLLCVVSEPAMGAISPHNHLLPAQPLHFQMLS